MTREVPGLPESIAAGLFDLDGVLTDTAAVHRRAWRRTFDGFLEQYVGEGFRPFSDTDYLDYVDGRPRLDGVREFLRSRDIELPDGAPDDPPEAWTVTALGEAKNRLLLDLLEREGVRVYPGSVDYLAAVRAAGLAVAVVTSSANAGVVLAAAGLGEAFQARVDGTVIRQRALRGKPAPDSFLAAAAALGVAPEHAAVFEDAVSGVRAGRAGGFGYVVGVDRMRDGRHEQALRDAGADVVVPDLDRLGDGV
ncbi:HAD family hydrolase [Nocardia otitidiscaviarum]|uniref:HAD family hydrolase n=1 Tax=Nocardia otitidiscaviarum TaxID=1823 RepID=UPI002B4AB1DF|nr:beta-phosphoglucomutase family hydrolase [Nocardia otitidiscaviarum]